MLRLHIARQIAALDTALTARSRRPRACARLKRAAEGPGLVECTKLLRDLGALRKLIGELDAAEAKAAAAPQKPVWEEEEDTPEMHARFVEHFRRKVA